MEATETDRDWVAHDIATNKMFADHQKEIKQVSKYVITQALKRSFLQEQGTRVAVYTKCWDETIDWCTTNCKAEWEISRDPVLSSPTIVKRELKLSSGTLDTNEMEVLWVNALARQENIDAAEASGQPFPYHYMWFESKDEALLFKLTWGGQ